MSDVAVYMVVNLHVTDAPTYRQYEKGFFPLLKRYGGEFVTYDDAALTLEGSSPRTGRRSFSSSRPRRRPAPGLPTPKTWRCPSTAAPARGWSS
jgi:Domain of unknown function (DUF1330)